MAAKDPFEADLEALFAEPPSFGDTDAFAAAVERRLEPQPELSPAIRLGLIGAAGAAGALVAVGGLAALTPPALGVVDQLHTGLTQASESLQAVAGGALGALDPVVLWTLVGASMVGLLLYGPAREI